MIYFPNAKINLGLNIVSKREDGYHNLETIFYPLNIKDALEIIEKEDLGKDFFFESGIKLDSLPENNLVIKALEAMRIRYSFPPVEIHLLKKIPFGAGLGGGSSDAAFMLKLINDKFNLKASNNELAEIALNLGADCPFFIYNKPVFATGVGEKFENIELSLAEYNFVLIKPNIYISTKEAFSGIKPKKPTIPLNEIIQYPISDWKYLMVNDFEPNTFINHPYIKTIKETLYNNGALYAAMSGSGSSVYGVFKEINVDFKKLFPECYVWEGKSL